MDDWQTTPDNLITIRDREYYTPIVKDWLILKWCYENNIQARRHKAGLGLDVWAVKDPKDVVLFALRWGTGDMQDDEY